MKPLNSLGQFKSQGGVKVSSPNLLPSEGWCNTCKLPKPIDEMVVVHMRRAKVYYMRPLCKDCNNKRERGHRREYKTMYLRRWRRENARLNDSYWKGSAEVRERQRVNAARRFKDETYHDALLIQGRFRRRGLRISIQEAKDFLQRFGRCYPSRPGLTRKGLLACERIRNAQRRGGRKRFSAFEIRLIVYDDGLFIKPAKQIRPYQHASRILGQWHQAQRVAA